MRAPFKSFISFVRRHRFPVLLAFLLPLGYLAEIVPQYRLDLYPVEGRTVVHHTFLYGDCPYYRTTMVSLLRDGDLDLRNNFPPRSHWPLYPGASPIGNVALGQRDEWYPKHSLLLSFVALPFYAVGREPALLIFNLLQLTALGIGIWYCARRHATDVTALAVTLWFAFGTMLRPASYNFSPDVLSTLIVVTGYLAVLSGRAATAGALFGLAVWAKWSNLVLLPFPLFYLFWRGETLRPAVRFGIAVAVPVVALGLMNLHMFGSPTVTPYDRIIIFRSGAIAVMSARHVFKAALLQTLWEQLAGHPTTSLLVSAPPVVLMIPGLVVMWRTARAEVLLLVALCAAQMAFYVTYRPWWQSNFGHRFLLTIIALSAIPVAALFARVFGETWSTHPGPATAVSHGSE